MPSSSLFCSQTNGWQSPDTLNPFPGIHTQLPASSKKKQTYSDPVIFFFQVTYQFKPRPPALIQDRRLIIPCFFLHQAEGSYHCSNLIFAECLVQMCEATVLPCVFTGWRQPALTLPFHLEHLEQAPAMGRSQQLLCFFSPKPFRRLCSSIRKVHHQ